ncbi:glycosyltransferase family 4 protein [Corynebacterium sp. HS2168-gen11]|uniref:glycosyltransferase family 4 protein n=1 Tax=Corynebacterium sp. HS2168-gen11 TaxID=2974027 RepID=UPI00216B56E2|nr:glycosyltransferase family 4 protein [Corynebacterium sp. HS2168-gen11]MCS4536171.1 glycosyltransferase family 4 protein [Corynebacterium sp. HS2168-gen11]
MRILVVTNDFPPTIGGIQSYIRDYLETLPAQDVVVFASTQDAAAAQQWDASVEYTVYRYPHALMLPTLNMRREMQRIIRAENIDTVWFAAAAPLAILGRAAKQAGATKVIASTHGHEVGWSMLPIARQILNIIGRYADTITYISAYTRNRFARAINAKEYYWLPSGVDIERFHPVSESQRAHIRDTLGLKQESLIVVCISRVVRRKGQDQLIKVWPSILARHPNAHLLIVGTGSYLPTVEALAEKSGLKDSRIHLLGRIGDTEMVQYLQAADIFAMPSRTIANGLDVEGLGIVYLEAQAVGLPVIAGNSGGSAETVTKDTAIVVEGTSIPQLREALFTLLDDASLRANMGKAGRAHVMVHWSWQRMGQRLREVLNYT